MKKHHGGYILVSEFEYERFKKALEATNRYRVDTLYWPPGAHGAVRDATNEIYITELTGEKRSYALGGEGSAKRIYEDALALATMEIPGPPWQS